MRKRAREQEHEREREREREKREDEKESKTDEENSPVREIALRIQTTQRNRAGEQPASVLFGQAGTRESY